METVHINDLQQGQYINHNGEVITLEKSKELLESGAMPVLHTVSDEYIGRVLDSLHDAREAGQDPGDFCEPDPQAKRIVYDELLVRFFKMVKPNGDVSGLFKSNDEDMIADQRKKLWMIGYSLLEINQEEHKQLEREMEN